MIDLLVVDDHTIFRAGLARLVSDEPGIRVTGEASDGNAALSLIRQHPYDVVVMDINMGQRNGLDTLSSLRVDRPHLPVIMLSMYVEAQYARLAQRARANAYLSKDSSPEELVRAIRHVASGGIYVTPNFGAAPARTQESASGSAHEALSPREMQVMLKIVRGVALTEIGTQMCVSVKTIGSHRTRILAKLGLSSNAELVQYAMRHGLVD
jgi:two-component system invasion response regulator UvrY